VCTTGSVLQCCTPATRSWCTYSGHQLLIRFLQLPLLFGSRATYRFKTSSQFTTLLGCCTVVLHSLLTMSIDRSRYGCATGYGTSGPDRDNVAMDLTVQAHMGIIDVTGFPDGPPVMVRDPQRDLGPTLIIECLTVQCAVSSRTLKIVRLRGSFFPVRGLITDCNCTQAGVAFMDFMAGTHLYAAIVTALVEATKTGQGRGKGP